MKGERWITALEGAALAFCIALGGCGCMVTAFEMDVSMTTAALCCGVCALVMAVCFSFRQRWAVLCMLALAGGYLWQSHKAETGAEALARHISQIYDMAYSCGTLQWSSKTLTAADLTVGICLVGCLTALVICWVVCCRRWTAAGLVAALIPLGTCLVVTDTVPQETWLFWLLLGTLLLLLTQTARRKAPVQGNRLLVLLAVPAALALAVLFMAVPQAAYTPRESGGESVLLALQDWVQNLTEATGKEEETEIPWNGSTVSVDRVDLRLVGPKSQSRYRVMTVTAAQDGPLYLRGQAYDTYDGKSWMASPETWGGDTPENWNAGEPVGEVTIATRTVQSMIYLPYHPGDWSQYGDMVQGKVENAEELTGYTVLQTRAADTGAPWLSWEDEQRYLTLPESTWSAARAYLTQTMGEEALNHMTGRTMAEAVIALVRNSASYDLNTRRMSGDSEDFAMWFLEQSDTGYCVHFATAATVLLRAVGIPARYVTGYLVQGEAGAPVNVETGNGHAWVEAYLEGSGWTLLEPTPAQEDSQSETTQNSQQATQPSRESATSPTSGQEEQTKPSQTGESTRPSSGGTTGGGNSQNANWGKGLKILGWTAALCAGILGQWQLRLELRRRKQRRGKPNARALALWREVEKLSRLLKETPDPELLALAQKAKYSQHTLRRDELARFHAYLEDARKRLRQRPLPRRFVDRLIFAAY